MPTRRDLPVSLTPLIRDTCLCLHVQRAARAVARRYDAALRPLGLTNWQFSLLTSLNVPEPAGLARIASLLGTDRTTLTANLKPLARRGLISVSVAAVDRRRRVLALTPAGRGLLGAALPAWKRTQAAVERLVTGAGSNPNRLRAILRALS